MDKEDFRQKVKEIREREWIRDSLSLRDKAPEESLKIMFDMVKFGEKLREAGRRCEP
jgi:hypothetical protein